MLNDAWSLHTDMAANPPFEYNTGPVEKNKFSVFLLDLWRNQLWQWLEEGCKRMFGVCIQT